MREKAVNEPNRMGALFFSSRKEQRDEEGEDGGSGGGREGGVGSGGGRECLTLRRGCGRSLFMPLP